MRLLPLALVTLAAAPTLAPVSPPAQADGKGFYRQPALHGDTIVFSAEGDLWTVPTSGGTAQRLTTHPGIENHPVVSPDGQTVAFTARYEGPTEVYTMPLAGGVPARSDVRGRRRGRHDLHALRASSSTRRATTRHPARPAARRARPGDEGAAPDPPEPGQRGLLRRHRQDPLLRAARVPQQRDEALPRRHRAQGLEVRGGRARGRCLTCDYDGESHSPRWWNGRVYFVSDRDGTMNLWSMDERRPGPAPAHAPRRLGRPRALARPRPAGLPGRRRPLALRHGQRRGTPAADPPGLRLRPAAREVGQGADGVPDLGAPAPRGATPWCSPPAAGSSWRRPSRGGWCGSRASRACATATWCSCRTASGCSASPTRAASSSS